MSLVHFLAGRAISLAIGITLATAFWWIIVKVLGIEGVDVEVTPVYAPRSFSGEATIPASNPPAVEDASTAGPVRSGYGATSLTPFAALRSLKTGQANPSPASGGTPTKDRSSVAATFGRSARRVR